MTIRTIAILMTACLAAGAVSGCSTTANTRADHTAAPTVAAAPKPPGELDPMYRPLNGVDLSRYKSAGDGLLLIARFGEYDLLLTEPGKTQTVYGRARGIYNSKESYLRYTRFYSSGYYGKFSGYMWRWRKNKGEPAPLVGRLTYPGTGQLGQERLEIVGAFDPYIYEKPVFSQARDSVIVLREGLLSFIDQSGGLVDKRYVVNRFTMYWDSSSSYILAPFRQEKVDQFVLLDPKADEITSKYTIASALPEFELVLPSPERMAAAIKDGTDNHRAMFMRDFSLRDLLIQRKINADHLLLKPFGPIRDKGYVQYDSDERARRGRGLGYTGQSAFLYSYKTDKTYLQPYSDRIDKVEPVLTLPSLKDIVINGQLGVNQQCMGKTDGMVVLSGQCDPDAPGFPLTVMTQLSDHQFIINVWSDIDRRSAYLLTGGQFSKEKFYRWTVDAFMVDKTVKPAATLAALRTGKDPFSDKLVAFASQGQEKQACQKQAVAVSNAEKALKFNPDINYRLKRYKHDLGGWDDMESAIRMMKDGHSGTPVGYFNDQVWDGLSKMKADVDHRLTALKRYQGVRNSVCQADPQRMSELVSALEGFKKALSGSMDQLHRTYYQQAVELERRVRAAAENRANARNAAAMAMFLNNLKASLDADLAARQAQSNSIARSMIAARKSVDAQIADVRERNEAYFANKAPVVAMPQTGTIKPVAMPAQSLDLSGKAEVYPGGRKPNRLGLKDALAQAEAKSKRLRRQSAAGASATAAAGGAGAASGATATARKAKTKTATGGAAICVAPGKNANNKPTDFAYYYSYGRDIDEQVADAQARKLYRAEYSSIPDCMRSDEHHVGALVVVEWDGADASGAELRYYGMGFGQSVGEAEKGAVNNLADRRWGWGTSKGYRVVYAKQY